MESAKLFFKNLKLKSETNFPSLGFILVGIYFGLVDLHFVYKAYTLSLYFYSALAVGHLFLLALILQTWSESYIQINKTVLLFIYAASSVFLAHEIW
jgi:hypothetical protein